jgi:aminotransferase
VLLNTPHNPTGRVLSRAELERLEQLCREFNVVVISDEVYQDFVFDGREHLSPLGLDGLRNRTIALGSFSKAFMASGWRIGYALAAPELSSCVRRAHEATTAGAPAPLQRAVTSLLADAAYRADVRRTHQAQRDQLVDVLDGIGFRCSRPEGSVFLMADTSAFGFADDVSFARHLVQEIGVSVAPGSCFFSEPQTGPPLVRFCFAKRDETLARAAARLVKLKPKRPGAPRGAGRD